jgi:diacylglycerol kinase (ATP)
MRVIAIINTKAKMYDKKLINNCLNFLRKNNVSIEIFYPVDQRELMSLLNESSNYDLVVIGGGDGTVSLSSEILRKQKTPFTIIPIGRGNTFYKTVYKDINPIMLFKALSKGFNEELLDAGLLEGMRSFVLGVSIGFIPNIIIDAERINFLGGRPAYLISALWNIFKRIESFTVEIIADNASIYFGSSALVSIGLVPYRAGRFKLFPNADLKDGLLDILMIPPIKRFEALNLLRLSTKGTHIKKYHAIYYQASKIKVKVIDEGLLTEMDGDIIGVKNEITALALHSLLRIALPSILH